MMKMQDKSIFFSFYILLNFYLSTLRFQECKTKSNYPYEKDWLNFLQRLVDDVHRK